MNLEDIKKLSELARVDMPDEELIEIGNSFDAILAYVGQIQEVEVDSLNEAYLIKNVMREDVATNKRGEYTEKLLAEMPDTQDGYLKVKSIL